MRGAERARGGAGIALAATLVAGWLAGCTPGDPAATAAPLPAGVTVNVYQTRTDLPARRLEIAVSNGGEQDLTITAAEFESTQFAGPAVWSSRPGGTIVRAGFGVDLPVQLPEPACADPDPIGIVRLSFTTADGAAGAVELPAVDRYDRLPDMRAEECYAAAVESIAALAIDEPVRIDEIAGGPTAFVRVSVSPTGATGSFSIDAIEDTVLLALRDPAGGSAERLDLGLRVAGTDPPGSFEIPILPGRCDAHAIAEDKQGTIFILDVTAPDGTSGRVRIAAAPEARASIYAFYADYCGLPR